MPKTPNLTAAHLRDLARTGADVTLKRLLAEIIAIERTFPELRLPQRRRAVRNAVRQATTRTRRMSAAARKTISERIRYANNRAEVSHQPTRQRERYMRRFKSVAHGQRFLAVHDVVRNLFTVDRLRAGHQRLLRTRAFVTWNAVAAA